MPAVLRPLPGFRLRRLVGLVEQIELELGGEIRRHALRAEPGDLRLQHGPRAVRDRLVMMVVEDVAEDQRGPRQPRDAPERRQVGLHDEVAVALFPVGDGVARHRLHVDVVGEQVVAAVRLLVGAVEENTRPGSACRSGGPACRESRPRPCRSRRRRRPAAAPSKSNAGHAGFLPLSKIRPARGV